MRFKKALTIIIILFIFNPYAIYTYNDKYLPRAFAVLDDIDNCLSEAAISDKVNSTYAEGAFYNVTWTGSICRAYVHNATIDGNTFDSTGHVGPYTKDSGTTTLLNMVGDHPGSDKEYASYIEWDIAFMSWDNLNISDIHLHIYHSSGAAGGPKISNMTYQPSTSTAETVFKDSRNGSEFGNFAPWVGAQQKNIDLASPADDELEVVRANKQSWYALGIYDSNSANQNWITFWSEENPGGSAPTIQIDYTGEFANEPCQPAGVELLDPDADGWIIANNRFYTLKASWTNANLTTNNEWAIALTDGFTWINITWSANNNTFYEDDGSLFVKVSQTGGDWIYNWNQTTLDLWVLFSIYMEEGVIDSGPVDIYQKCDGALGWELDSGGVAAIPGGIYNDGGLIEASTINNASFTVGGDWFEICAYSIGMAEVNQTWYKLQSFSTQFAVHIYENQSGVWVPEDQFFQTQQNAPAEKWASVQDWDIKIKIWGWDNVTSNYVLMSQAQMFMADGDEGATDQWVAIKTIFTDTLGVVEQKTWNAFIEEEPAARYRTWFDVWVDQQNASSVMGQRSNAYYFGMTSGGWLSWNNWAPMIFNSTEAIGYLDIHDGNDAITSASQFGMMKIEFELQFSGDPSSNSENTEYLVCIEDINIKEIRLQAAGVALSGVNIPIYNAPKVPDMPIGGILGPIYAAIASIASGIVEAFSGIASIIWESILDQFPGLRDFITNTSALLVSSVGLATSLIGYISNLFTWGTGFLQYIGLPINIITGTLGYLTDFVNTVIPEGSRFGVVMILVMLQMTVLMDYLISGRESYVFDYARNVWKMTGAVIDIAIKMANLTIRFLNLVNPF